MYKTVRSFTHLGEKISTKSSDLLLETPLEIIINDDRSILIMFTPGMARELVIGFIFTEGLIRKLSEVEECIISSVGKEDGEQVIEARVTISSARPLPTTTQSKRVSYLQGPH